MNYLLDTNILSEIRKPEPRRNVGVSQWFAKANPETLFVSVLVLGEIRKGIESKRRSDPAQAIALESWLEQLQKHFSDRILPIDLATTQVWGMAQSIRPFPVIDGLLAATAQSHQMQLVTRNTKDLEGWPAKSLLLNPFLESAV